MPFGKTVEDSEAMDLFLSVCCTGEFVQSTCIACGQYVDRTTNINIG